MALYASGVKIDPTLSGTLSGVGTGAYNAIGSNYDAAKKKMQQEGQVLGRPAGSNSYGAQRLGQTQGLDVGNLESSLGGGVGNTAYKDTLDQREYEQNRQLAEEAGRLNKPDLLSQILGGIGSVGGTAAGIYGAYGKNRTPSMPPGSAFPRGDTAMYQPFTYPMYGRS